MPEAETKEPKPKAWIRLGHTKCCEISGFEAIGTEHTCFAYVAGGPVADWILNRVNSHAALVEAAESAVKVIYRATPMVDGDDEAVSKVVRDLADEMDAVRKQLTAAIAAAREE